MKPLTWSIGGLVFAAWGTLMLLLFQTVQNGGNAPFSDMPASLVLRQVLQNEVTSQLGIYEGRQRIGSVTISPAHLPANQIAFDGNVIAPDGSGGHRSISFSLLLDLRPSDFAVQNITLRLLRHRPDFNALFDLAMEKKRLRYEIHSGELNLAAQDVSLTSGALLASLPALTGLPALPLPALDAGQMTPHLRAHRASEIIREERLDVFRLRAGLGELQATATLGPLGEFFIVRSSTEYSLLADGLDPAHYLQ